MWCEFTISTSVILGNHRYTIESRLHIAEGTLTRIDKINGELMTHQLSESSSIDDVYFPLFALVVRCNDLHLVESTKSKE